MTTNDSPLAAPHIGNLINDFIQKQRKSPSALSRKLDIHINNVLKIRKKESIHLKLLWEISNIYQHNFIADVAMQMPEHFTGTLQNALSEKDQVIATVKSELDMVIKERDLLKELLKR